MTALAVGDANDEVSRARAAVVAARAALAQDGRELELARQEVWRAYCAEVAAARAVRDAVSALPWHGRLRYRVKGWLRL